jgi:FMN-dependent NADH-azoreductase
MKTFEHNATTDEIIERDLTADEIAQIELDAKESKSQLDAFKAKQEAKSALLDRLGITADEAALLLS